MILYDWKKVYKHTEGNCRLIMRVIEMLANNTIPRNKKDELYELKLQNYYGNSFLRNPLALYNNRIYYNSQHCAEYVAFASMRNLGFYKLQKEIRLPVDIIPNRLCSYILANPLLEVQDRMINFRFE